MFSESLELKDIIKYSVKCFNWIVYLIVVNVDLFEWMKNILNFLIWVLILKGSKKKVSKYLK